MAAEIGTRMFHARLKPRYEGYGLIRKTGRGRRDHGRTGDRAIDAGNQTSWPKSLDTLHGGAELMAKAVAEATDNKFQIRTFAAGEIVPGLQVLDAVQNGTVEMGHTASYYYFGKDPTFTFDSCIPFGPNARLNQAWYMLGGGKEILNEFYKSYNVTSLLAGNTTCQMGGWFRKEINTLDDLQGLKFRIGGFAGRVKLHGFSPAIMEASYKATKDLNNEVAATNANFKKVYDSITAYTSTGYQWFQVAEIGYDNFMARHAQT